MKYNKRLKNDLFADVRPIQEHPWKLREKLITAMIQRFMKLFHQSAIMSEAEGEGWSFQLVRYTQHVAKIQAQILNEGKVGYDHQVIFNYKSATKEQCNDFLREQRQLCSLGFIEVQYPNWLLEQWRGSAAKAKEIAQK